MGITFENSSGMMCESCDLKPAVKKLITPKKSIELCYGCVMHLAGILRDVK